MKRHWYGMMTPPKRAIEGLMDTQIGDRRGVADKVALVIATGLGLGYFPVAPGTVGSFLGVALILFVSKMRLMAGQRLAFYLVLTALVTAAGIWSASRAEAIFGRKDPPQIVIDEVVGQLLSFGLILKNPSLALLLVGFVFFRFFDIVKPFPIRRLERIPLGLGIVLDDVAAGLYASLLVSFIEIYVPGLA